MLFSSFAANIIPNLTGILGVIAAFSVAIFVHELGHFMFAKLFGVKVDTFSIGFGKKLFGFRKGDTEYKFCLLPFGGYVKMVGTMSKELEEVLEGDKPATPQEKAEAEIVAAELAAPAPVSLAEGVQEEIDALRNKPYWQKLLVFAAGCINNVLTALLIFFLMCWIGYHVPPKAPAAIAGVDLISEAASPLKVGDQITAINGEAIADNDSFLLHFLEKEKASDFSAPTTLAVNRDGSSTTVELPLTPPLDEPLPAGSTIIGIGEQPIDTPEEARKAALAQANKDKTQIHVTLQLTDGETTTMQVAPVAAMGPWWPILAYYAPSPARIQMLLPNLPAEKSGLKNDDTIVAINGQPVQNSYEATRLLRSMPGKTAQVQVDRPADSGTTTSHTYALEIRPNPDNPTLGQIGVAFGAARTELVKMGFVESIKEAFLRAKGMMVSYIEALGRIFGSSLQTIRENLAGPVGISVQFFKVAQSGWFQFLLTFAMFNIVLAMTNLLPLPILDGGHILFATIEAIIRRPLPAKFMLGVYNLFTFLIIGLALVITFNDLIMNAWRVIGK